MNAEVMECKAAEQVSSNSFDDAAAAQMERMIADFGRMYRERNDALEEVSRAHHDALMRLSRAAEYRDDDTGVHIIRIGKLAGELALLLGEPSAFATLLEQAAPMHDVGKIGIPDRVLKKPGPLSPDERAEMNRHPAIGAEILGKSRIPLFRLAAEVALSHHERFDGSGYPSGLDGESIPLPGASWRSSTSSMRSRWTVATGRPSAKPRHSRCCLRSAARRSIPAWWIASTQTATS
jgi:putative two-component system response regulator